MPGTAPEENPPTELPTPTPFRVTVSAFIKKINVLSVCVGGSSFNLLHLSYAILPPKLPSCLYLLTISFGTMKADTTMSPSSWQVKFVAGGSEGNIQCQGSRSHLNLQDSEKA